MVRGWGTNSPGIDMSSLSGGDLSCLRTVPLPMLKCHDTHVLLSSRHIDHPPSSTGWPDSCSMAAPNSGAGSLGPCRQLRVRLLQISTESSRERTTPPATPPATTTSSPPAGSSWVVHVWPVLPCTMPLAGTSSVAVRNQDLLVILVCPSSPASPVVEPPVINLYCGITTIQANIHQL